MCLRLRQPIDKEKYGIAYKYLKNILSVLFDAFQSGKGPMYFATFPQVPDTKGLKNAKKIAKCYSSTRILIVKNSTWVSMQVSPRLGNPRTQVATVTTAAILSELLVVYLYSGFCNLLSNTQTTNQFIYPVIIIPK